MWLKYTWAVIAETGFTSRPVRGKSVCFLAPALSFASRYSRLKFHIPVSGCCFYARLEQEQVQNIMLPWMTKRQWQRTNASLSHTAAAGYVLDISSGSVPAVCSDPPARRAALSRGTQQFWPVCTCHRCLPAAAVAAVSDQAAWLSSRCGCCLRQWPRIEKLALWSLHLV